MFSSFFLLFPQFFTETIKKHFAVMHSASLSLLCFRIFFDCLCTFTKHWARRRSRGPFLQLQKASLVTLCCPPCCTRNAQVFPTALFISQIRNNQVFNPCGSSLANHLWKVLGKEATSEHSKLGKAEVHNSHPLTDIFFTVVPRSALKRLGLQLQRASLFQAGLAGHRGGTPMGASRSFWQSPRAGCS